MYIGNARLTTKEWISPRTLILELELESEQTFIPGQFFTFFFQREGKKIPRSYSILGMEGKKLTLCIKLVEQGVASEVFEAAKLGDEFSLRGPFGRFVYQEDENPNVFLIATDTGIVPFHAMLEQGEILKKNVTLLFGSRNQEEIYFREQYEELAKKDNFTFLPTLTREEWDGLQGRVQKHLPEWAIFTTFYICGRKEMVLEVVDLLKKKGVADKHIHIERYD